MAGQDYNVFWSARPFHIVGSYPINDWKATKESEIRARRQRVDQLRAAFFNSDFSAPTDEPEDNSDSQEHCLRRWAINKSWSYCPNCKLLSREKLLPSFDTSKLNTVKYCPC